MGHVVPDNHPSHPRVVDRMGGERLQNPIKEGSLRLCSHIHMLLIKHSTHELHYLADAHVLACLDAFNPISTRRFTGNRGCGRWPLLNSLLVSRVSRQRGELRHLQPGVYQ